MSEQRVSDERLAHMGAGDWRTLSDDEQIDLWRDLRDARAQLAAWEPVVRAAGKWADTLHAYGLPMPADMHRTLYAAIDAMHPEHRP